MQVAVNCSFRRGSEIIVAEKQTKVVTPEDLAFGGQLRQWRQSLRLSQDALGKRWGGKSQSQVSSYERGETPVERRDLERLSSALERRFHDILDAWIECQRGTVPAGETKPSLSYILPSGIKAYAEEDGVALEFSPEDLLKIDRLFQSIKAQKQRD